jgi:hypothetical protein
MFLPNLRRTLDDLNRYLQRSLVEMDLVFKTSNGRPSCDCCTISNRCMFYRFYLIQSSLSFRSGSSTVPPCADQISWRWNESLRKLSPVWNEIRLVASVQVREHLGAGDELAAPELRTEQYRYRYGLMSSSSRKVRSVGSATSMETRIWKTPQLGLPFTPRNSTAPRQLIAHMPTKSWYE